MCLGGGCGAGVGARRGYGGCRLKEFGQAGVGAAVGEARERGCRRCAVFGQYHGRLQVGWVLWGFGRGILRRRHGRLGQCARGVLDADGASEAAGMYPDCRLPGLSDGESFSGRIRYLVGNGACDDVELSDGASLLRPLRFLTGRKAASPETLAFVPPRSAATTLCTHCRLVFNPLCAVPLF